MSRFGRDVEAIEQDIATATTFYDAYEGDVVDIITQLKAAREGSA